MVTDTPHTNACAVLRRAKRYGTGNRTHGRRPYGKRWWETSMWDAISMRRDGRRMIWVLMGEALESGDNNTVQIDRATARIILRGLLLTDEVVK